MAGIPISMTFTWPLHISAMVAFLFVFISVIRGRRKFVPASSAPFQELREVPKRLFQQLPTWLRVLSLVSLVYVVANFSS